MKAILIVDDSAAIRTVTKLALAHLGADLVEAVDGEQALEVLATRQFSLVISDVNMPKLSGLDLLGRLRQDARWKFLPVIMLTTEGCKTEIDKGRALGARAWITKPFKADVLVDTVQKIVPM